MISFNDHKQASEMKGGTLLLAALLLVPPVILPAAEVASGPVSMMPHTGDYTMLWWSDGPLSLLGRDLPSTTATLCLQSGYWGLAFDTKRVQALRAGEWAVMNMEQAMLTGRGALTGLPAINWECAVVVAGHRFPCTGHVEPNDSFYQPVRIVESGRYFQRVVIEGLQFIDTSGKKLSGDARLEISAWPDRLSLRLELKPDVLPVNGTVELSLGKRHASAALTANTSLTLEVFNETASSSPVLKADSALKVGFDEALGCQTIQLPEQPWTNTNGTEYPEEYLDQLDRWNFTLQNDSNRPMVARLMFTQQHDLNLTGFTPMLCETNGTPTGLPVQISKDWHRRPEKGVLPNEGPWFHGFAFVHLPPKSKRDLAFQMVYARYGGVFAASLAQLSLIGWGYNQFWDEVAIGSFGESICFEPGRTQRRCFIDDMRPLLTLPQVPEAKPWGWAQNCGGGDFLMWQDEQGHYQPMCATRTDYRAYGPCLTDASYSEESIGGELGAHIEVSVPRSQDYLRTFIHLRYDVHRPMRWQRLAFFQLGADFYNETPDRLVAVGDEKNLREEWEPKGKDGYDRIAVPMPGKQPWVSVHGLDYSELSPGSAAASRGVIVRSWRAVLGGKSTSLPYASFFRNKPDGNNYRTIAELAPAPGIQELLPGDFVEADLELVVFPVKAAAYYGPDEDFKKILTQEADTWQLVKREASGNAIKCEAKSGTILNSYPIRVAVDDHQLADIKVQGGIGFVPITISGLTASKGYSLYIDGDRLCQSVHGNDFWQTDYDSATHHWQQTYNVAFRTSRTHTVHFSLADSHNDD